MTPSSTPAADVPPLAMEPSMAEFLNRRYEEYLELVKRSDGHVANRDGADKSWVERAMWDYQQHYRKATRGC